MKQYFLVLFKSSKALPLGFWGGWPTLPFSAAQNPGKKPPPLRNFGGAPSRGVFLLPRAAAPLPLPQIPQPGRSSGFGGFTPLFPYFFPPKMGSLGFFKIKFGSLSPKSFFFPGDSPFLGAPLLNFPKFWGPPPFCPLFCPPRPPAPGAPRRLFAPAAASASPPPRGIRRPAPPPPL